MDTGSLIAFLLARNGEGYAGGEEKAWTREVDGSLTIAAQRGPWRLHDNFFGGEPYGGREVIFFEERPVWMLSYYGWVDQAWDATLVYGFLRQALRVSDAAFPVRGPRHYDSAKLSYRNSWEGSLTKFSGCEHIVDDSSATIYEAHYAGGLVDARGGV
jgi:Domain of unknown function (DUF5680)